MKVGDKVRVVMVDTRWRGYVQDLISYIGKQGKLSCSEPNAWYLDNSNGYCFPPEWLELIEEAQPEPPKLVIEAGKYYKTRGGDKAEIYKVIYGTGIISSGSIKLHGAVYNGNQWNISVWNEEGKYMIEQSSADLIAPWIDEPVVNWDAMPAWANWVAMEDEGDWFWLTNEPIMADDGFNTLHGKWGSIPEAYYPQFSGDWKDSKVKRPAKERE